MSNLFLLIFIVFLHQTDYVSYSTLYEYNSFSIDFKRQTISNNL